MVYTSFADTTLQINLFTQQVLTQYFIWSQSHTHIHIDQLRKENLMFYTSFADTTLQINLFSPGPSEAPQGWGG